MRNGVSVVSKQLHHHHEITLSAEITGLGLAVNCGNQEVARITCGWMKSLEREGLSPDCLVR